MLKSNLPAPRQRDVFSNEYHSPRIKHGKSGLLYLGIVLFLFCSATGGIPLIGQEASVRSRGIKSKLPVREEVPDRTPATTQELNYVDLNNWTQTGGNSDWNIEPGGRTVLQTINGSPAFFVTPDEHINVAVQGTIAVLDMDSWQDDDYIGFVFGYKQPTGQTTGGPYEFVLFDWRRANPDYKWLSQINGSPDLWSHSGSGINILATNTNTGGWQFDRTYDFRILYLENRVRVSIDGVTIFDVSGTFEPGKFGFYNYSQSYVRYGNILYGPGSLEEVPPVATADTYGMNWNTTLTKDSSEGILANDYDPNLDPFTIHLVDDVDHGTLIPDYDDGSFTYTPTTDYQGSDSFSYYLSDNDGNSDTVTVEISIMEPNQAPTDIYLSNNQVAAGSANGTSIGNFSTDDPNSSDSHDYMLIDNGGGRFGISGNTLQVASALLLDPGVYTITVRSTDLRGLFLNKDFDITVSIVNTPPTDITLAPSTITENSPGLTVIGTLTTTDATPGDTHIYTLLDSNSGRFNLQVDQVRLSATGQVDYETATSHQIQVRATDAGGLSFDKYLTISVLNANEPPTDITLSNHTVSENDAGAVVGSLSASDPDADESAAFSIRLDAADLFTITGSTLKLQDGKSADYESSPSHTIGIRVTDGGGLTFDKEFTISILDVNDPPVCSTPIPDQTATEDQAFAYTFPADTFQDPDSGDTLGYTATLEDDSPLPAWLSFTGANRTFSGTPANADVGAISIKVTADDGHASRINDVFTLTVTNTNDAPVIATPIPDQSATEDQAFTYTFPADSFHDDDTGDTLGYTATLGDDSPLPTWLHFAAAGRTFSGTPLEQHTGSITIKVTAEDGHDTSAADSFLLTIGAVNDAPIISGATSQTAVEDTDKAITGLSIADDDAGGSDLQVTLNVLQGVLSLAHTTGLHMTQGDGSEDAAMVFTASLTDINAALAHITYRSEENYSGPDTLTLSVDDQGHTGAGGALNDVEPITITVNPANDAPVLTLPGEQKMDENRDHQITGISVADPDIGDEDLRIALSCAKGTLSLAQVAGLSFTVGNGSRNDAMTFTGTATHINQALSILTYSSQRDYCGQDTIEISVDDQGHTGAGGALTDAGNILIRIENVNSPPVIQNPISAQGSEDESFMVPGVTIDDADAGDKELKITVSAEHGKVTAQLAPLARKSGEVISNRILSFSGSIDQINLTLETLSYRGNPDYNGDDAIVIRANDLGNTGPGGPKTTVDEIPVTLLPVNDAPTADAGDDETVNERTNAYLDGSGSSDPDGDELTYCWTQLEGSPVTLTGADTSQPSFTAPEVGIRGERLVFKLEVEDPDGLKDTDTVAILIGDPSFRLFFLHTECAGERETEIGLINLSPHQPLEGELQAFDASGRPIAAALPIVLGPSGHRTVNLRRRYPEAAMVSYLVFTSSSREVRGYAKYFAPGQYAASVPAACHINTGVVFLSNIASTKFWTTEIALLNPTTAPSTLTLAFDNGQTRSLAVGAGELIAFTIRELFGGDPQPDLHCGVIRGADGFMGLTLIGTPHQLSAHELNDLSTDTLIFPFFGADASLWSGIALYNPSDLPCDLKVTAYSSAGTPLSSQTHILQGHEQYSLARSYQDPSPLTGWIKVVSNGCVLGQAFLGTYDSRGMSGYSNSGSVGTAGCFPDIENTDTTRLVLVNTEDAPAVVTLTAYDAIGRPLAERTLQLSVREQVHNSAAAFFGGQDLAGTTHIGFSSTKRITGLQIMKSSDETTMDLLPCIITDAVN